MKTYTGVGSRQAPEDMLQMMQRIGYALGCSGWTLRSGSAGGADTAFELGSDFSGGRKEIYIPWKRFSNRSCNEYGVAVPSDSLAEKAAQIASQLHPAWARCSSATKLLHSRNCFQVLGPALDMPSTMLVCWGKINKQGTILGGTATAWKLAQQYNIPCFNLNVSADYERISRWLQSQ